jgi:predicted metalloprotease with PDZ domain
MNGTRVIRNTVSVTVVAVFAFGGPSLRAAPIPPPRDVPYAGTLQLEVDATDLDHRVFHVTETVPVAGAGPLVLLYPKWLPGNHSTTGPVELLAGLIITAGRDGSRLEWRRDPETMHAFQVEVPAGVSELRLSFQFITPTSPEQGRRVMTPDLFGLQWEKTLLYPAGHYARQISVQPTIRLPAGWQFATALDGAQRSGDTVRFASVALEKLVDSPLYAGRYYRRVELDTNTRAPVHLDVFADRPSELEAKPGQIEAHRRMVREALALFGAPHFAHYDFLLVISDNLTGLGLEHHQSSENAVGTGYFTDWNGTAAGRDLLPHEMEHSWNGKFRRPADLWTPSYEVPMHDSLLWVYEGQAELWGMVLATRSGLWSPEFARDALAQYAATYQLGRAGRLWRNLQDTTNQPIIAYRTPQSYPSWQRGKDYYTEGAFLWLDADSKIRELTRGRKSLDDFAKAFFGGQAGEPGSLTYTFDDVVRTLGGVVAHDWNGFLKARLDGHGPGAPLDGLTRGGWRLAYTDQPSAFTTIVDKVGKQASYSYSLGLTVSDTDGRITEVVWGSPAFNAGLAPGMTLLAVNGRAWSAAVLKEAIVAARGLKEPIDLLVRNYDTFQTAHLDYHDGLRYPHLERIEGTPDRLGELLKPALAPTSSTLSR